MTYFIKHSSCPKCNSKDNNAIYSDGSEYCFGGCGYKKFPDYKKFNPNYNKEMKLPNEIKTKPADASNIIGTEGLLWLEKYGLTAEDILRNNINWSQKERQLIFSLGNVWQARNFIEGRRKYFTQGDIRELVYIYHSDGTHMVNSDMPTLVLVEDVVSAIKVSKVFDCMPLLGAHLSTARATRIAKLYKNIIVWLDSNKWKEATKISQKLNLIVDNSRTVYTPLDPKEYSLEEIKTTLTN